MSEHQQQQQAQKLVIVVTRKSRTRNRYHAAVQGHPGVWDVGDSEAEAIGKLVVTAQSHGFPIEVVRPPEGGAG